MLGSFINGFILNIQFFSTIPITKKAIPITKENLRRAIQLFPVLGLLQGGMLAVLYYILVEWTFFSSLAIAFFLWLFIILITGALHLDGWIDSSDAFFSYRDKKRRIEILADPRVGAFGLISGIVLLSARFLFIYEIVSMSNELTFTLILFIPFIGKIFMGMMLTLVPPVKQGGLGHLFHESSDSYIFVYYSLYAVFAFGILGLVQFSALYITLFMLFFMLLLYFIARAKSLAWFGGMNGDIVGGSTEGVETVLWLVVWLFHYYAMG